MHKKGMYGLFGRILSFSLNKAKEKGQKGGPA